MDAILVFSIYFIVGFVRYLELTILSIFASESGLALIEAAAWRNVALTAPFTGVIARMLERYCV